MKKRVLFISILIWLSGVSVFAQSNPVLFQPLTWEQASLIAARENKLVLVSVGAVDAKIQKSIQKQSELTHYMLKNVVAIQIDVNTTFGKEFEQRLLMYPYPTFAFFMPYGDLVGVVAPDKVEQKPNVLREVFQLAQKVAEKKKKNSRSILFVDTDIEAAITLAAKEDKKVFVYISADNNQASLLMEKNVFHLDEVSDLYNRNFVCLHLSGEEAVGVIQKNQIKEYPAFLYLTKKGKLLYGAEGYFSEDEFITNGNKALQKAKGIPFEALSDKEAQEKAQRLNKWIFIDNYVDGREHQNIVDTVFTDPNVTDFFVKHFINISREGKQARFVFTAANGEELHRVIKIDGEKELLNEAKRVVDGRGMEALQDRYEGGYDGASFVEEYMLVLSRAGKKKEASQVAMDYLTRLLPPSLKEEKYWNLFNQYVVEASVPFFEYLLRQRDELFALYGQEPVNGKITALWTAGAEHFVKDSSFDEAGFKAYAKQFKKEKVENWRQTVRHARMSAAENVGDWKTFIVLAEERWNEEKLADAELYRWAIKINEQCGDEGQRYKMAQWLSARVFEIERQEYLSGRVKIDSYKGFFKKLVSDLLKE